MLLRTLTNKLINKLLNRFGVFSESFLGFDDGSAIGYVPRKDMLDYWSASGKIYPIYLSYDAEERQYTVDKPFLSTWDKPSGEKLTEEELLDIKNKLSLFIEKKGNAALKIRPLSE